MHDSIDVFNSTPIDYEINQQDHYQAQSKPAFKFWEDTFKKKLHHTIDIQENQFEDAEESVNPARN